MQVRPYHYLMKVFSLHIFLSLILPPVAATNVYWPPVFLGNAPLPYLLLLPLPQDKEVCLACGTRNPTGTVTCFTCEVPLPSPATSHPPRPPSPLAPLPEPPVLRPVSGSSYMMCGRCGRVNVSDARFCDWCGSKVRGMADNEGVWLTMRGDVL